MKRRGGYRVYIVRCADGTYYTGSTNDLAHRLTAHNNGHGAKYVRGRGPVTLVYVKAYASCASALRAECRLKQRSRAEKEALIRGSRRA